MKNILNAKQQLRVEIAALKKQYSKNELLQLSEEVLSVVEITGVFQDAKNIFVYASLADEVQTLDFIERWSDKKNFYLPAVTPQGLVFRKYTSSSDLEKASLGILESNGAIYEDYHKVDLIIVPGVAFDRKKNRLGRGPRLLRSFFEGIVC